MIVNDIKKEEEVQSGIGFFKFQPLSIRERTIYCALRVASYPKYP